jgi:hypothetical protein
MGEVSTIETTEAVSKGNFREIVKKGQESWRSLKAKPWMEFSQAADLPEYVNKSFFNALEDNLPDYIPDKVRENLKNTHPIPIISVGVLIDKRTEKYENSFIELETRLPSNIAPEEEENWAIGIELLDEIATDTLALDILNNMANNPKENKAKWYKPFVRAFNSTSKELKACERGIEIVRRAFGEQRFEKFRRSLIVGMLTGDNSSANEMATELGFGDINRLAESLGRRSFYGQTKEDRGKIFKSFYDEEEDSRGRTRNSLSLGGLYSSPFPGVIQIIGMTPSIHSAAIALNSTIVVQSLDKLMHSRDPVDKIFYFSTALLNVIAAGLNVPSATSSPRVVIHEMVHYLSQDVNHVGLYPVVSSIKKV